MTPRADSPEQPAARRPAKPGSGIRAPERARLTSRAAVLAVVFCAIAMSLAYPVREYIGQRRQIDQLEAQQHSLSAQLGRLEKEHQQLTSNAYVEQQARDRLHMCLPEQSCYVIINPKPPPGQTASARAPGTPWYQRLWTSVQQADQGQQRGQGHRAGQAQQSGQGQQGGQSQQGRQSQQAGQGGR